MQCVYHYLLDRIVRFYVQERRNTPNYHVLQKLLDYTKILMDFCCFRIENISSFTLKQTVELFNRWYSGKTDLDTNRRFSPHGWNKGNVFTLRVWQWSGLDLLTWIETILSFANPPGCTKTNHQLDYHSDVLLICFATLFEYALSPLWITVCDHFGPLVRLAVDSETIPSRSRLGILVKEPICRPCSVLIPISDFDMPCTDDPIGGRLWLQHRIGWQTGQALKTATPTSSLWYSINNNPCTYRRMKEAWAISPKIVDRCPRYKGEPIVGAVINQLLTRRETTWVF